MSLATAAPTRVDIAARLHELRQPDAYAHRAYDIQTRETHISWVLLAGDHAYKIRKPVNFGFLDFSTLERRREDCEAELALNRRLCPDLYLGLEQVVERDGRLAVGGAGDPVEPVVHMRRLPDRGMLPDLIDRHAVDDRVMVRIADHLADFHASAATGPGVDEFGAACAIRANWDENFAQTAACDEAVLPDAQRDVIRAYVDAFLARNVQLFERRVAEGHIRDGHGDLHAGSVCVVRRHLYLFDCVEFSARFRCADVAAEVAFLAMDLDHLGRADLAHVFVDAYRRRSHDEALEALLGFYKCYRAYVRGKVLAFRLAEPDLGRGERERITREARAYFDLAYTYACPPPRPVLLVAMGRPASGKTTLARGLAGRLALVHLSSDVVRKQLIGMQPTEHAAEHFEQGLYSRKMTQRTYAVLRRMAASWLKRGQSVVLDATYGKPAERLALRQLQRRCGAPMLAIVCRADDAVLQARLAARATTQGIVSDARLELWPVLRAAFVEPAELAGVLDVDTSQPSGQVLDTTLASVRRTVWGG